MYKTTNILIRTFFLGSLLIEGINAQAPDFKLSESNGFNYLKPSRPERATLPLKSDLLGAIPGKVLHFTFTNNAGQDYSAPNSEAAVFVKQGQFWGCAVNTSGEIIPNTAYQWWSSPPPTFTNYLPYSTTAVALSSSHLLSATEDGRILRNYLSTSWVPDGAQIPSQFTFPNQNRKIVDLLTADNYTMFLLENGNIDGWGPGYTSWREANPPPNRGTDNIVEVQGSENFIVTLKSNGTIDVHDIDGSMGLAIKNATPSNLTNIVRISASKAHIMALDSFGVIHSWAAPPFNIGINPRPHRTDVVAISAGSTGPGSCALYEDGSLVAWGPNGAMTNFYGETGTMPSYISFNGRTGFVVVPEKSTINYITKLGTSFKTSGIAKVTNSPSLYSLYTQQERNDFGAANYLIGSNQGVATVLSNPTSYNLYTPTSIMDLKMGGMIIEKDQAGTANLRLKLLESTNLTSWSQADEVIWQFPITSGKHFLRVNASPEN